MYVGFDVIVLTWIVINADCYRNLLLCVFAQGIDKHNSCYHV